MPVHINWRKLREYKDEFANKLKNGEFEMTANEEEKERVKQSLEALAYITQYLEWAQEEFARERRSKREYSMFAPKV